MAKKHSKRRSNGEGGISYNKTSKRWVVAYQIGIRDDGKPIKKYPTFGTEQEAVAALRQLQMLYPSDGSGKMDPNITVGEWLDFFLENYKRFEIKDTTLGSYECRIRMIKKRLGGVKLVNLNASHIQAMVNDMLRNKSRSTMMKDYSLLGSALKKAKQMGKIKEHPMDDVVIPKEEVVELEENPALSEEDTRRLILALEKETPLTRAAIILYLAAGLRLGEALGLKWKDINFEERLFRVERAVCIPHHKNAPAGQKAKPVLSTPKTSASIRAVYPPDLVFCALEEQREAQQEFFALHGRVWSEDELVFQTKNFTIVHPRNMQERAERIFKALGIKGGHVHALRHTFCTRSMENTTSFYEAELVSKNMGHSNLKITLGTYTKKADERRREAAIDLNKLFSKIINENAAND
ncbi:site-specific integrase [Ruminococcaceae bacterium OttesenSCG-928-O06]|nr:site-specific integrase [Ruminococcaceae bacterium OttesenSCG-928-O06]